MSHAARVNTAWLAPTVDDYLSPRIEPLPPTRHMIIEDGPTLIATGPRLCGKQRYLAEAALAAMRDGKRVAWGSEVCTYELLTLVLRRCVMHEDCREHGGVGRACYESTSGASGAAEGVER